MAMLNYRRAITCDAGFLEAYNNLVGAFISSSVQFSSTKLISLGINYPLFPLCCFQGNALKDAGRVEEAIHCYRVSYIHFWIEVCFHFSLFCYFSKLSSWCMQQCLSLQPNHPQALTNLGNIYMEWQGVLNCIIIFFCFYSLFGDMEVRKHSNQVIFRVVIPNSAGTCQVPLHSVTRQLQL